MKANGTTHVVDWDALVKALDMACEIRECTCIDVGALLGVSPSSLTRLRQGKHLSGDALASLVAWLFPGSIPLWIKKAS